MAQASDPTGLGLTLVRDQRIWNAAPHNAFTDLAWFNNRFYCTFREGSAHVSPDGKIRVISSTNGDNWRSETLISSTLADLRDPKLSITPTGELMLAGGAAYNQTYNGMDYQSHVWFSNNGSTWSADASVNVPDVWMWRPTWHNGVCYSIAEDGPGITWVTPYCQSADGVHWNVVVPSLVSSEDSPNEVSMAFAGNGTAYALVRRDSGSATALLGTATAAGNYADWTWKDLGVRIGGPNLTVLPDGRLLAAVRLYDGTMRESLAMIDPSAGSLTEALTLPSGGDCGYAGMVLRDKTLWVSYYGSQTGQASIYLAEVNVSSIPEPATGWLLCGAALTFGATMAHKLRRSHNA